MVAYSRVFAPLLAFAAVTVLALAACSSSPTADASDAAVPGSFGCCSDYQPGCTLFRNGPKRSADDNCIDGFDGTVPDPGQPGWEHRVDTYGCGVWYPPPNARTIVCGLSRPPVPERDSGDASSSDVGDAGVDATRDAAGDAPTD